MSKRTTVKKRKRGSVREVRSVSWWKEAQALSAAPGRASPRSWSAAPGRLGYLSAETGPAL